MTDEQIAELLVEAIEDDDSDVKVMSGKGMKLSEDPLSYDIEYTIAGELNNQEIISNLMHEEPTNE